jgi:hypothetical protein
MRRAHPLPSVSSVHEAVHVEGGGSAKHEVGCPTDAGCENTERFAASVLGAETVDETLTGRVLLQKEDGGLAVGPLEMGVADLGAGGAHDLTGRSLLALDEARVGEEVTDTREAPDVMELVEQREGKDAPHARDGLQTQEGLRIVDLGSIEDRVLESPDDLVEPSGQGEVGLDARAYHGVGDRFGETDATSWVMERGGGCGQARADGRSCGCG